MANWRKSTHPKHVTFLFHRFGFTCFCLFYYTARRTFIGNIYKKVKDPNLVGVLSGHKEGSKAFSRYREIDDEMKKELINLLE